MKKISEMTLEELQEAKSIIDSILDKDLSDNAKEYYTYQEKEILDAIETRKVEATTQEDEQADPFRLSEQNEDTSIEVKEHNNMDCICSDGDSIHTRKVEHYIKNADGRLIPVNCETIEKVIIVLKGGDFDETE